jgi:hypothetical protein
MGERTTSIVWGANKHSGESMTHSVLAESRFAWNDRNTILGRAERVKKSAGELALDTGESGIGSDQEFHVSSFSLGYIRELYRGNGISIGLGGLATINAVPEDLKIAYGSRTPAGGMVFFRLRPMGGATSMAGMHHH